MIQARDPDTLEPKGHYFILFDTHEAALAYKDRLEHLWHLSKTHVPGARPLFPRRHGLPLGKPFTPTPLPRGLRRTAHGEDVAELVRAFTLVAPSQRRDVVLSRAGPSRVAELHAEGGFVGRLAARAASRFLVLARLDGGRLTPATLRRAIEDDGARRGRPWRVVNLERDGILPFGKSILKAQDQAQAKAEAESARDSVVSEGSGQGLPDGEGSDGARKGMSTPTSELQEGGDKYRQYPRFIIPFADKEEAHRFVQNWHRRELKIQMGVGGKSRLSWEETRIINTTILW